MFYGQGHKNDFEYIMGYTSKWLEMYFQFCPMVLALSSKVEKMFMHSVCLHVLTVVNILEISLNLCMLFICDRIYNVENDMYVFFLHLCDLNVLLQRYTSFQIHFWPIGEGR